MHVEVDYRSQWPYKQIIDRPLLGAELHAIEMMLCYDEMNIVLFE